MKRLSFIPEIFIWLLFSVVAGFGYAFSFFEYVESKAHMTASDIVIPTLVWILLAAICTFLLKTAQNTKCFVQFSRAERLFLECSVLALLLIGGWVFRFVDYFHGVWPAELDNTYFQYAQVSQNAEMYLNPHPASRLYVAFLHVICMFLGNIYEVGAFIQFLLLLAAVIVWYATIRKAFGVVSALFYVAGAMLLPDSIQTSMQCNPAMLLFVIYGSIAFLMVQYAYSKVSGFLAVVCEFFLAILLMAAVFLDISGVLLIVACWLAVRCHAGKKKGSGFLSVFIACLGMIAGAALFTIVQAKVYGMNYENAFFFQTYSELTWKIPNLNNIQAFVFSLGTHPIFIVAIAVISIYWFLNKKQAFTWIMSSILFLFTLQLLELDTYLQHDFMIYMGISTLLGISVQQYLMSPVDPAKAKKEPAVTVIHFEEEPAVTVPEKPQIFIPKSMEIPKRVSKPKVDFAIEVEQNKMHYDYPVEDTADFDI